MPRKGVQKIIEISIKGEYSYVGVRPGEFINDSGGETTQTTDVRNLP
jgi:hypothetical protein